MRIEIDRDKIPYKFNLKSDNKLYKLDIKHFPYNNGIYIDIYDDDDYLILENEKLIYGRPLGFFLMKDRNNNFDEDFLNCYIVPLSLDKKEVPITYDNFCKTVFLEYFSLEEINE